MTLDHSSLKSAVAQLQESFEYLHSEQARSDARVRRQFRSATIQAFEFTYELAVKTIRRRLSQIVANPDELRRIDFADLMREAADAGLVREAPAFLGYREMRNKTSHTYDAELAEATVAAMSDFLYDVRFLLDRLEGRARGTD